MQEEIECKEPGLTLLRSRALDQFASWPAHELILMKFEWNQSADWQAIMVNHQPQRVEDVAQDEWKELEMINWLPELLA